MRYVWLSKVNFPQVISRYRPVWGVAFRWEWKVCYEYQYWSQSQEYYDWRYNEQVCPTRASMRKAVRAITGNECYRNIETKRRLAQVNWEDYNDSFTYNAKGNGNGR